MKWISVKDRLPDKDYRYLTYQPSMDKNSPFIYIAWYHPDQKRWTLLPSVLCDSITHWMDIPKGPEDL